MLHLPMHDDANIIVAGVSISMNGHLKGAITWSDNCMNSINDYLIRVINPCYVNNIEKISTTTQ